MSKNYSVCSLSVFTTIPDTAKPKTERKDHTVTAVNDVAVVNKVNDVNVLAIVDVVGND